MLTNEIKPDFSAISDVRGRAIPRWIKVGAVAAATALAGGLAAAWYYRSTLEELREAEAGQAIPDFGISAGHVDEDT